MQTKCTRCYDKGKLGGCPKCGKDSTESQEQIIFSKEVDTILIPTKYKGVSWTKPEKAENNLFSNFDNDLEKIHKKFMVGKPIKFSLFLAAPQNYDKLTFAYSCMQASLMHKKVVAPLLSTSDIRRLMRISQISPFFKLYQSWTYDAVMSADILFVTVTHIDDNRNNDIMLLHELYDTRARLDLPTIVISDYALESLVPKWESKIYSVLIGDGKNVDLLRYPRILQRFNYLGGDSDE